MTVAAVIASLGVFPCVVGCAMTHPQVPQRREQEVWPKELAGRALGEVTDEYVLYAADPETAKELTIWLNAQIAELRSDHEDLVIRNGVVLAIEAKSEANQRIAAWEAHKRSRNATQSWAQRIKTLFEDAGQQRSYCAARKPYFRASFAMPIADARALGVLPAQPPDVAWVCFLTADRHLNEAFDRLTRKHWRSHQQNVKKVPASVRIINAPAMAIWAPFRWLISKKYRELDTKLMHLDRQEKLMEQILATGLPQEERNEAIEQLKRNVSEKWSEIWTRRPVD